MNDLSIERSTEVAFNEIMSPIGQNPDSGFRGGVFNRPFDEAIDVEGSSFETESSDRSRGDDLRDLRSNDNLPIPNRKNISSLDEASTGNNEPGQGEFDYDQLPVSDEIKKLFRLVDIYVPEEVEIVAPLKCFIPNYIPAIVSIVKAVLKIVF